MAAASLTPATRRAKNPSMTRDEFKASQRREFIIEGIKFWLLVFSFIVVVGLFFYYVTPYLRVPDMSPDHPASTDSTDKLKDRRFKDLKD